MGDVHNHQRGSPSSLCTVTCAPRGKAERVDVASLDMSDRNVLEQCDFEFPGSPFDDDASPETIQVDLGQGRVRVRIWGGQRRGEEEFVF